MLDPFKDEIDKTHSVAAPGQITNLKRKSLYSV